MRRLWLLGTLLLLAACAGEQDPVPRADGSEARPAETVAVQAGDQRRTVQLPDGTERSFLLHVPPAFEAGDPLPLVVVLHGAPGSAREMERVTGFDAVADDEGFLVAYPDAFDAADQVAALVDHLEAVTPVDPRRIYATGFSRGAMTTYLLTNDLAHRIAAFAPVSGIQYGAAPDAPTSLIAVEGGRDELAGSFPAVDRRWARAAGCGRAVTTHVTVAGSPALRSVARCRARTEHVVYRVERMGHTWPRQATRLVWEFFAAHPLHAS